MPFETTTAPTDVLRDFGIVRSAGPNLVALTRQERLRNCIPKQVKVWATVCDTAHLPGLSSPAVAVPNA
jgi:hypothetical protein